MWFDINFLAVLVAAVVSFAIGHLWYSPVLFGKQWMAEMGKTPEEMERSMKDGMGRILGLGFAVSFVTAYALAVLISLATISAPADGIKLAFVVWFGFVATLHYQGILYGEKSKHLFLIQAGYDLVALLAMGLILGLWR